MSLLTEKTETIYKSNTKVQKRTQSQHRKACKLNTKLTHTQTSIQEKQTNQIKIQNSQQRKPEIQINQIKIQKVDIEKQ